MVIDVGYLRYCWPAPATIVGLLLAGLALRGGSVRVIDGVVEAHGPWLMRMLRTCIPLEGGAAALTVGHVVLAQDARMLELTRAHERVHVRQYERWGVLLFVAYPLASAWAVLHGRHFYFDNVFEREARVV